MPSLHKSINLFKDVNKTSKEDINNQKISTVIFLILLTLSVIALFLYSLLTPITETVVIKQPTLTVYKELAEKYPNTLVCPCTSVSNEYNKFISSFTPIFNQICSSDFISDAWLNYVNYRPFSESQYHYHLDFRHSAYSFFYMLRLICTLASEKINSHLIELNSTMLFTENVISEDTFLANIETAREHFIATSENDFVITFDSVLAISSSGDSYNRLGTKWQLIVMPIPPIYPGSPTANGWAGTIYPPNSCLDTSYCSTLTGIYLRKRPNETTSNLRWGLYRAELQFEIPGIHVGTFILYAVLQSNLSCLYNQTCLSYLNIYLNDSLSPFNATPLTIHSSAYLSTLPKINDLVKKLMVDHWELDSSYESYFNACNSSTCTYTYVHQFHASFIITTVVAFIGGIVTILMILILPVVEFFSKYTKRCYRQSSSSSISVSYNNDFETQTNAINTEQQRRSFAEIKSFLINLNFFSDPDEKNEWHLRNQLLSTRLFIISMVITFCILVVYTSTSSVSKTDFIKQPSIDIYLTLQTKYPQTLSCPCSSISNEHNQFISFQPRFHPVCNSDFITNKWGQFLEYSVSLALDPNDFRFNNIPFFPVISAFCQLSLKIINSQLFIFNSTKYITKHVQQIDLFQSQIQQLIDNMKQTTKNSFQLLILMLRQSVWGNALFTTASYTYTSDSTDNYDNSSALETKNINQVFYPQIYTLDSPTTCSCKLQATTCNRLSDILRPNVIRNYSSLFTVPGYYIGCYITESLFRSTFECFINETCFKKIADAIYPTSTNPYNATAMQLNNSQYNATTTVEYIIANLMIEEWNNITSYQSYFKQCNPSLCTYSYSLKGDISYVFATIIGLIGGLTTIFKMLIPFIVIKIRQIQQKRKIDMISSITDQNKQTTSKGQKLKRIILTFNLFKNRNRRSEEQLRYQRISTRVFLIINFITLIILLSYIALDYVTHTVSKNNPTLIDFYELYQQYPNTIRCPCKTVAIEYKQFITFQPRLHPICSSTLIHENSQWTKIDYPQNLVDSQGRPLHITQRDDFRQIAGIFFQLINSFCQLSSQMINTTLDSFYSDTLITLNLITLEQFQIQIKELITQFLQNMGRSFINSLYIAENMTAGNMLVSALSTDSIFTLYPDYFYRTYYDYPNSFYSVEYGHYYIYEYVYNRHDQMYNSSDTGNYCDCQTSPWCIQQSIVYDLDKTTKLFSPPGIFVGCYLIPATLRSDLRCFFDIDCIQELASSLSLSYINVSDIVLTTSHYQSTSSLLEIFANVMVEEWNNQTSYNNYFNECQPSICTATYINRGNIIYIVTTLIGLIGGLTKIYKFSVPIIVKMTICYIIPFLRKKCSTNNDTHAVHNA